jgi:hypothetical protein
LKSVLKSEENKVEFQSYQIQGSTRNRDSSKKNFTGSFPGFHLSEGRNQNKFARFKLGIAKPVKG